MVSTQTLDEFLEKHAKCGMRSTRTEGEFCRVKCKCGATYLTTWGVYNVLLMYAHMG